MYEIMKNDDNKNKNSWMLPKSFTDFTEELLEAVPMALAAPILTYQKTNAQRDLLKIMIEAKSRERSEILATMQILAKHGQLTPEITQQLVVIYMQQPY